MKILKTAIPIVLTFMVIVSLTSCKGAIDKNIYIDPLNVQRLDNAGRVYDIEISGFNSDIFAVGLITYPEVQGLLMSVDAKEKVRWVSQLPDAYWSYLMDLHVSDGHCIAVGDVAYEEFIDEAKSIHVSDATIAEFDLEGKLIWIKKLDTNGEFSYFTHVSQSIDGGYVAVGKVCDDYDAEKYHTIAVKYDEDGEEQWRQDYYSLGEDANDTVSITTADDGGFILAGGIKDKDNPDGPSLSLLYKIYENGEKEWVKTHGKKNVYSHYINAITKTTDGGYVAIEGGTYMGATMFITKYDGIGNIVWEKAYNLENEKNYLIFNSIIETEEGDLVAVGYMGGRRNSSGKRLPMKGFVIKIDRKGKIQGKYQFEDGVSREFTDIVQASDGSYYASGYTRIDAEEIYDQDKGIIVNFELP